MDSRLGSLDTQSRDKGNRDFYIPDLPLVYIFVYLCKVLSRWMLKCRILSIMDRGRPSTDAPPMPDEPTSINTAQVEQSVAHTLLTYVEYPQACPTVCTYMYVSMY